MNSTMVLKCQVCHLSVTMVVSLVLRFNPHVGEMLAESHFLLPRTKVIWVVQWHFKIARYGSVVPFLLLFLCGSEVPVPSRVENNSWTLDIFYVVVQLDL
jgi:hypothetical protein